MKTRALCGLTLVGFACLAGPARAALKDQNLPPLLERFRKFVMPKESPPVSPDERARRQRRIRALSQIFVVTVDEKICATETQRERLRPLAERLVQGQARLFPERGDEYVNLSQSYFLAAAGRATDEELAAMLDLLQTKRWRTACQDNNATFLEERLRPNLAAKLGASPAASKLWQPEDAEVAVSNFLEKHSVEQTVAIRAHMTLRAEEAERVGGLAPEKARRLRLAALGAAEACLARWRLQFEQSIRMWLGEADGRNVQQLLEGDFPRSAWMDYRAAETQPLWEETLGREMEPGQRDALKKEVAQRAAFRHSAVASLILAELDRRVQLSSEQCEKLESRVNEVVAQYENDAQAYIPGGYAWYQHTYPLMVPLGGLADELAATLTAEQMKQWKGCREFQNAASTWASLERNRERRAK